VSRNIRHPAHGVLGEDAVITPIHHTVAVAASRSHP
jgi:hypothetical protein